MKKKIASRFNGVYWKKSSGKRMAQISHEGKLQHIGTFKDEMEAAKAWDAKARSLRGAATATNLPDPGEICRGPFPTQVCARLVSMHSSLLGSATD